MKILRTNKYKEVDKLTNYPVGTFVSTERGYFYIVNSSKMYKITTKRVLDSWAPPRVVEAPFSAVSKYRIAAKMKFRNGSLIKNYADGRVYLIENGQRRHVTTPDLLPQLGAKEKDVTIVSMDELNLHEEGESL